MTKFEPPEVIRLEFMSDTGRIWTVTHEFRCALLPAGIGEPPIPGSAYLSGRDAARVCFAVVGQDLSNASLRR